MSEQQRSSGDVLIVRLPRPFSKDEVEAINSHFDQVGKQLGMAVFMSPFGMETEISRDTSSLVEALTAMVAQQTKLIEALTLNTASNQQMVQAMLRDEDRDDVMGVDDAPGYLNQR